MEDYLEDVGNNNDNEAGANNKAGANNEAPNNDQDNLATGGGGDLMEDETDSMIVEDGGMNNKDNNNEVNDYDNNNDDANDSANNNNDDANDILGGGGGMDRLEAELEQMMEGEAGNPSNHSSSITISSVRDSVVAPHTLKRYCKEILKFLIGAGKTSLIGYKLWHYFGWMKSKQEHPTSVYMHLRPEFKRH